MTRQGGGGEKHEVYAAASGGHLFMTYIYRAGGGGMAPLASLDSLSAIKTLEFSIMDLMW